MVDENAVKECLQEWLENKFWEAYYNDAPSERCKKYIALDFYYSDTEDDDVAEVLDELEDSLELNDWKYLLKHSQPGPERGKLLRKVAELENK